jgi:hypothetical protein
MDTKIATLGLAGALTALAPVAGADASTTQKVAELMSPTSYSELLAPIPNAVELLKAANAADAARATAEGESFGNFQVAQYYYHDHHHHNNYWRRRHHHHDNYYRRRMRHHHHHHHDSYGAPGYYRPY